jgi:hypothetical protein
MTTLSTLFPAAGGGTIYPYVSNRWYPVTKVDSMNQTGGMSSGRDYLLPFMPRADVTVDEIGWVRATTGGANVYVGIYDTGGNLLTDCAVDSDTTQGLHAVSTTAVDLVAGTLYYLAVNQSATVVNSVAMSTSTGTLQDAYLLGIMQVGFDTTNGGSLPSAFYDELATGVSYKARTTAALSDPLTLTGFTYDGDTAIHMGIIPQ